MREAALAGGCEYRSGEDSLLCAKLLCRAYLEMRILFTVLFWCMELEPIPENLNSMKGVQKVTRRPEQCYARPKWLLGKDVMLQ